jgi:hypothetical protein
MSLAGSQRCPLIPLFSTPEAAIKITVALAERAILQVGSFLPGKVLDKYIVPSGTDDEENGDVNEH